MKLDNRLNAMTVDVEDYFQVSAFEGVVEKKIGIALVLEWETTHIGCWIYLQRITLNLHFSHLVG